MDDVFEESITSNFDQYFVLYGLYTISFSPRRFLTTI